MQKFSLSNGEKTISENPKKISIFEDIGNLPKKVSQAIYTCYNLHLNNH
jgi:hypothetical protein